MLYIIEYESRAYSGRANTNCINLTGDFLQILLSRAIALDIVLMDGKCSGFLAFCAFPPAESRTS